MPQPCATTVGRAVVEGLPKYKGCKQNIQPTLYLPATPKPSWKSRLYVAGTSCNDVANNARHVLRPFFSSRIVARTVRDPRTEIRLKQYWATTIRPMPHGSGVRRVRTWFMRLRTNGIKISGAFVRSGVVHFPDPRGQNRSAFVRSSGRRARRKARCDSAKAG